jgi:hypothetical protein
MVVYVVAYFVRPYATNQETQRYFIPALTLKMVGAIFLGVLYQFYYSGGDTFYYHTYGSRIIWGALCDDFFVGVELLFSNGDFVPGAYKYFTYITFYNDGPSFAVIRIATVFDLLTFSTYSGTAVFFSVVSFSGSWAMFIAFYRKYSHLHFQIALATLFIPTVIFWGSGILKDTIVLAALGFSVYCVDRIFILNHFKKMDIVVLLFSLFLIFSIKKFILQAFVPSIILWVCFRYLTKIQSTLLKIMVGPFVVMVFAIAGYYSVIKVGEGDTRYSVEKLAKTAKITAYDIRYFSGRNAGSGYSLGELDGTFGSMLKLAPQAVNVTLFRPYLWEVKNPLMFLSAVEAFAFLLVTFYIIAKKRFSVVLGSFNDPNVVFCFVFAVSFAFAVGISTYNFGTLARYKIPMLPFFAMALVLILNYENKETKLEELEEKE